MRTLLRSFVRYSALSAAAILVVAVIESYRGEIVSSSPVEWAKTVAILWGLSMAGGLVLAVNSWLHEVWNPPKDSN